MSTDDQGEKDEDESEYDTAAEVQRTPFSRRTGGYNAIGFLGFGRWRLLSERHLPQFVRDACNMVVDGRHADDFWFPGSTSRIDLFWTMRLSWAATRGSVVALKVPRYALVLPDKVFQ